MICNNLFDQKSTFVTQQLFPWLHAFWSDDKISASIYLLTKPFITISHDVTPYMVRSHHTSWHRFIYHRFTPWTTISHYTPSYNSKPHHSIQMSPDISWSSILSRGQNADYDFSNFPFIFFSSTITKFHYFQACFFFMFRLCIFTFNRWH